MRDVLHAIATALVIAIATLCTIVQVADVLHALDRLRHDDGVVQQVGHDTGRRDTGTRSAGAEQRGSTVSARVDLRP